MLKRNSGQPTLSNFIKIKKTDQTPCQTPEALYTVILGRYEPFSSPG